MKSLFSSFKKTSKKDWLAKVEKDLKGKPLDSLDWKINADWVVSPFAHSDDAEESFPPLVGKKTANAWELGVRIFVKNIKTANAEALFLLEKGATAICFDLQKNPTKKELETLLQGIQHEWVSTHFILPKNSWKSIVTHFLSILKNKKQQLKKVAGSFQFKNNNTIASKDFETIQVFSQQLPLVKFITINAIPFYQGKENTVKELTQLFHQANNYLEKWNDQNLELQTLLPHLQFAMQLGDSYFLNIAKIRATKILWNLIVKNWKKSLKPSITIEIHLTSNTQTKDENYNKIKATTQAMSAIIGGADRLYIYPSDVFKNKKGTKNANRLALNIQHLMQLESYMDRVVDPAAGSYYLEILTDDLVEMVLSTLTDSTLKL